MACLLTLLMTTEHCGGVGIEVHGIELNCHRIVEHKVVLQQCSTAA